MRFFGDRLIYYDTPQIADHEKHTSGVKTPVPIERHWIAGDKSPAYHPCPFKASALKGSRTVTLIMLAFPLGVGALEVFYAVFFEDP